MFASDVRIETRPKKSKTIVSSLKKPKYSSDPQPNPTSYNSKENVTGGGETQKFLIFRLDIRLSGRLVKFSLDHLGIYNCDLKFFGVKVASLCPQVRRAARKFSKRLVSDGIGWDSLYYCCCCCCRFCCCCCCFCWWCFCCYCCCCYCCCF